jgi:transposase
MPKACSMDLRERVIEAVEEGASRREAAERFEVSVSSAIKWLQWWRLEGRRGPKPRGGSRSPLEDHEPALLALVAEHPDWTLAEFVVAMGKQKIPGRRSALWRFLERHGISRKKKSARDRARARGRRPRAPALAATAEAAQFVEPGLH